MHVVHDETNGAAAAFIEKYDAFGTPGWGKGAFIVGSDVVLHAIDCNSRGHVVAGGYHKMKTMISKVILLS